MPIPAKLVSKITSGQFVDLADLLSVNLRAVDQEPHTFLDSKLLVSRKRRLVEGGTQMNGGFHNLSDGGVCSSPSWMARPHKIQTVDNPNDTSFSKSGVVGIRSGLS